jgi:hypothetical protein
VRRLLWLGVGAAAAVAGARRLGLLDTGADGASGTAPAGTAARAVRTAFRAGAGTAGAVRSLSDARREFAAGMAEREQQLRHDLVGDVDVDALRAQRRAAREADAAPRAWREQAARGEREREDWAGGPTDDPDDREGDLPYAFY